MFITFEGIEGSGKSLQIARAEKYLLQNGIACIVTREPGGTEFGKAVRRILLDPQGAARKPESELLLYLADRYQHLKELIEPALERNITVISDRYHDATRAYQGAARKMSSVVIDEMARLLGIRDPDATILLDLEPSLGLERAWNRNNTVPSAGAEGRFEAEDFSFHRDVRNAYLELARLDPQRIRIVPADGTPDEVFLNIVPLLQEWCQLGRQSNQS
jgi:dTMP kinase